MPPLTPGRDRMNLLGQPQPIAGHARRAARPCPVRRRSARDAARGATSGSWTCPRPGSSLADPHAQSAPGTARPPTTMNARLVTTPSRQQGQPQRQDQRRDGRRGISTVSWFGRRRRRVYRLGCHDCALVRFLSADRRTRPENTTIHTTSTKCQYHETSSTPSVALLRQLAADHQAAARSSITITPTVTCRAVKADQRVKVVPNRLRLIVR